jgi:hypothetical protein
MAGPEVGCGGPDALAWDELEGGPCGPPGPAVEVEPHAQWPAQQPPGQANLDPVGAGLAVVPDRPAQQALANAEFAAVLDARPVLESGHVCLERDVGDPPE